MRLILILAFSVFGMAAAKAEPVNFAMLEYAPISNHFSDDGAPAEGYNENNNLLVFKLGREYQGGVNWNYNFTLGYAYFKNSYDETSHGPGIGAEASYTVLPQTSVYGGVDLGVVTGYEDNVDEDYVLFDSMIPFLTLNAGLEYDLGGELPSIRGGVKYAPGSIVDSDDVIAYTIATRLKF